MGHLFVTQADLTKLVLDDVIVPCDSQANFNRGFVGLFGENTVASTFEPSAYARPAEAVKESRTLWRVDATHSPRVWLLDSSVDTMPPGDDAISELVRRIREGLNAVAETTPARSATPTKRWRTVGLTLFGLRAGGLRPFYADVLARTLETLTEAVDTHGTLDLVLALRDRSDYAAVQHVRRADVAKHGPAKPWEGVLPEILRLADLAKEDRLVPFFGAGASKGAGLKGWWELLEVLGGDVGLSFKASRMESRDAALVISSSYEKDTDFRAAVVAALKSTRYPLTQALLASLRAPEALTSNFDDLYEEAYAGGPGIREHLLVLPREPYEPGLPWLMKIHGDVAAQQSIVLSRDDYIRFDYESIPMASVLQSAMLTKHILFVGYSVSDENVVRLARQVVHFREVHRRRSKSAEPAQDGERSKEGDNHKHEDNPVGTVLLLSHDPLREKLWEGVLRYLKLPGSLTTQPPGTDADNPTRDEPKVREDAAARDVDIALDLLAMHACKDSSYFLDDKYLKLLSGEEAALRDGLKALTQIASGPAGETAVGERISTLLADLGATSDELRTRSP